MGAVLHLLTQAKPSSTLEGQDSRETAMTIGEVAKHAGVNTSLIRFYEAEGMLPPASRGSNGYRNYPASTVDLLVFIETAKRLGFSLNEIKRGSPSAIAPHLSPRAMLKPLRKKLRDVEAHLAATTELRSNLLDLIHSFEACIATIHTTPRKAPPEKQPRASKAVSISRLR